jgi:hypothetical protein
VLCRVQVSSRPLTWRLDSGKGAIDLIEGWNKAKKLISKLRVYSKTRLSSSKRAGMFGIDLDSLKQDLDEFFDRMIASISDQARKLSSEEANSLLATETSFLALSLANSFESTRLLIVELHSTRESLPNLEVQSISIQKLKKFMDDQWLTQEDQDLTNYYSCLTSYEKIHDFIQVLHAHVEENMVFANF